MAASRAFSNRSSFLTLRGPLNTMFDFSQNGNDRVILNPETGEVKFADNAASRAAKQAQR